MGPFARLPPFLTRDQAKLKHMHDNALVGNNNLLENVPCALVPAQFIRAWRQWLFHPANERPESVDTSQFICDHGLLVLDPNSPGDLDVNAAIIRRSDWETLEALYVSILWLPRSFDERLIFE